MSRTLKVRGKIGSDHILTAVVPDDVPVGPASLTVFIESLHENRICAYGDLLNSGIVGDEDNFGDLPTTPAEFAAWRKKNWDYLQV